MAANLGTAWIQVKPSMNGVRGSILSGLKGTGADFSKDFSDDTRKNSPLMTGAIAGIAAAATSKAIEVVSSSLKQFVGSASEIQSLRASFESLTGDITQTNKVMTNLYEFGKKTAFTNEEIQSAGRSFLAVGQDADQMRESMSLAGDIAGATGANLGQLVLPLTQAFSRGKLQTQDFYQILNSGAGAMRGTLEEAYKAAGGVKNLQDAMAAGEITSDILWDAMRRATAQGGFAFEGAIKQSQTFNGRMSNLQETVTNLGLKLLGVNAITGEVQSGGIFDTLSKSVQWLVDNLPKMVDWLSQNKDWIMSIGVALGTVLGIIGAVKLATTAWAIAQGVLNAVMAANPIGLIVLAIAGLVAGLTYFFTQTEMGKQILTTFGQIAGQVWEGIKAGLKVVGDFFGSVFSTISSIVGGVFNWVRDNWQLLAAILFGPIGIAVGVISSNFGTIRAIFQGAWNFITGLWGQIGGFFSGIVNNITNAFSGVANIGKNIVQGLWNGINDMVGWISGKIKGFGDSVLSGIKNFFGIKSPSRVMRDQVGKMLGFGIADGITSSTKEAVRAAQTQSSAILRAFNATAGQTLGITSDLQLAAAGAGSAGSVFYITNPSPEETAAIVESRIKTQGGDV